MKTFLLVVAISVTASAIFTGVILMIGRIIGQFASVIEEIYGSKSTD